MSSYVYMKVLESAPLRYDRGIRLLSRGEIDQVYARVAELAAAPGRRLLDLGCGTGNLSIACRTRGADVVGIDSNAGMLEVARDKASSCQGPGTLAFVELNALEIEDRFAERSFDAAVSCLLFSELTAEERAYVLKTLRRLVKPGGSVVIADEVAPAAAAGRAWWRLTRAPLVGLTWLLTQTTTRALEGLEAALQSAGFGPVTSERLAGDFIVASGHVPEDAPC